MTRLFLLGAGGHCRASIEIAESIGYYNEIVVIDHKRDSRIDYQMLGRDVVSRQDWSKLLCSDSEYFIAIASRTERARLFRVF